MRTAVEPGRFKVLRAYWLSAECRVDPGDIVELADGLRISELMAAGKIEPADKATAERVRAGAFPFSDLPAELRRSWVYPV